MPTNSIEGFLRMKYLKYFIYFLPILLFITIDTLRNTHGGELGTKSNPVKFYFTPSGDTKRIATNAKDLLYYLEKETGYYFESAIPASFIAVYEAFGSKKADIAAGLSAFAYIMVHEKYGPDALLRIVRDNGETTYRGQFITRAGSGIDKIEEIEGHSIAYVDASSTSGYLLPNAMLRSKGIKPSQEVFGMTHENVVTMVYQKQVDVGATYSSPPDPKTGQIYDARMRVLPQFPDVAAKVKIIGYTEHIPNDPFIFSKYMPDGMKEKIVNAILKFVSTDYGKKVIYDTYDIVNLIPTKDSDYDGLRRMLKEQNIDYNKLIKK
jgi:phosphonate transport system substrate-binding protein